MTISYDKREILERLDQIDRSIRALQLHLGRYLTLECEFKLLLNKHHKLEKMHEQLLRYEPYRPKSKQVKLPEFDELPETDDWPLPSIKQQETVDGYIQNYE